MIQKPTLVIVVDQQHATTVITVATGLLAASFGKYFIKPEPDLDYVVNLMHSPTYAIDKVKILNLKNH